MSRLGCTGRFQSAVWFWVRGLYTKQSQANEGETCVWWIFYLKSAQFWIYTLLTFNSSGPSDLCAGPFDVEQLGPLDFCGGHLDVELLVS